MNHFLDDFFAIGFLVYEILLASNISSQHQKAGKSN